jgi:quinolinate synthase
MLSTGGMLRYAGEAEQDATGHSRQPREAVVATEVGMLYALEMAAPDVKFIPANPEASCVYMKMITLEKLRDALRDMKFVVSVPADVAEQARVPIDRMVAIG